MTRKLLKIALFGVIGLALVVVGVTVATVVHEIGPAGSRAIPARRSWCSNHLRQLGFLMQNYQAIHDKRVPAYWLTSSGEKGVSWRVLLSAIDSLIIANQLDLNQAWNQGKNSLLPRETPELLVCPRHKEEIERGVSSYVAIVDEEAVTPGEPPAIVGLLEMDREVAWAEPDYLPLSDVASTIRDDTHCENGFHLMLGNGEIHFFHRGADLSAVPEMLKAAAGKPWVKPDRYAHWHD